MGTKVRMPQIKPSLLTGAAGLVKRNALGQVPIIGSFSLALVAGSQLTSVKKKKNMNQVASVSKFLFT